VANYKDLCPQNENPLKEYRESEPMTPAKIKEHKPTAVSREMTEKITVPRYGSRLYNS
jgi:hypothetical protein